MKSAVLVIITSDQCGHCTRFKNTQMNILPAAIQRLINEGMDVEIVSIDVRGGAYPTDVKYPPKLQQAVAWYPMIMLFSKKEWEDHMTNTSSSITTPFVLNGSYDERTKRYDTAPPSTQVSQDVNNIVEWIKEKMRDPKFPSVPFRYTGHVLKNINPTHNFKEAPSSTSTHLGCVKFVTKKK